MEVSQNTMPRITEIEAGSGAYCAMDYGGNGIMMYSAQAERLAEKPGGLKPPILDSKLRPEFACESLAPFRRFGQRLLYHWYHLKDEML